MNFVKKWWMYGVGGLVLLFVASWAYRKFLSAPATTTTTAKDNMPTTTASTALNPATVGTTPTTSASGATTDPKAPTTLSSWGQEIETALNKFKGNKLEETALLKVMARNPRIDEALKSGSVDNLGAKDQLKLTNSVAKIEKKNAAAVAAAAKPNPHKRH